MAPTIERITEGASLGEGPHWDVATQALYYVDIFQRSLHKYVPATRKHTKVAVDQNPSIIIPVEGKKNQFVITQANQVQIINWDGESDSKVTLVETIATVEEGTPNKFNDGKCDSSGRLWVGTMDLNVTDVSKTPAAGALYSIIGPNKQVKSHRDKIHIANGLAWDDKTKKMYYIDSLKLAVDQYDFDVKNDTISNQNVWFSLKKHDIPGVPDGMSIDSDGNLWIAIFDGSRVIKVDTKNPETLLDTLMFPAKQVTSTAWGGKNFDELYVTTGCFENAGEQPNPPHDGAVYKITGTGSKGLPAVNFKF